MRIRNLMAAGLLVGIGFVGFAPVAHAQEEGERELSEDTEECIHLAEEADNPEACQESPNPILPPTNELIWGSISFVLLFAALTKFAYPGIKKGMEARTERIRTDLEGAESAKADAQRVLDEYRAQLADAKAEAGRIIEEARQQADALKRDQEQRLQTELATMRERAASDVESARNQALADLRNDVAALVSEGVDRVVRGGIDPATQQRLVDEYINGLAAPEQLRHRMADDRTSAYARAMFDVARAEGNLARIGDELFRFARALEGSDELRTALTDPHLPASRRQQIVEDLLGGKAEPSTIALVGLAVGTGRARELPAIIDSLVQMSAAESGKAVAEVRSPIELTADQRTRLADAVQKATGKQVEVKVVLDPTVLGGLITTVGDTVIDGSVRSRLEQLKHSF